METEQKRNKDAEKQRKEAQKLERQRLKEEKQQLKEYEAAKKRTLQESRRNAKPGECIKLMLVMIHPGILNYSCGPCILDTLNGASVKYEVKEQPHSNLISFWREVTEVVEVEHMKLQTRREEVVEDEVLMYLPMTTFVNYVHVTLSQGEGIGRQEVGLRQCVQEASRAVEGRTVTVIVQGHEKYFRDQKAKGQRAFRKNVAGVSGGSSKQSKKAALLEDVPDVSRLDIEQSLLQLQIYDQVNVHFVETDDEVGKTILRYTKAIAEAPFKREKLDTGIQLYLDGSGSVRIGRDGEGVRQAWQQQLHQFKGITAEVSNAIIAEYSNPRQLWLAYQKCSSEKEAKLLLQDIIVRRGVGVMATTRRVGKEMSGRICEFMTARDPRCILK